MGAKAKTGCPATLWRKSLYELEVTLSTVQETYTYKTTPHCDIHLEVYRESSVPRRTPVIVWIHGGALIGGSRNGKSEPKMEAFERWYISEGYAVVSIDYRLAPETKLPLIIEDVEDALKWVREKGADCIAIDPDRMGVVGHSAGGYLALMTGTFSSPPQAVVSFYGYSDITGDWLSKPDTHYCQQPLVSQEEAYRDVQGPPVTDASQRSGPNRFYLYCRQNGLWPKGVGGRDPEEDPSFFTPYRPHVNISKKYPPTLLLHGDQDTDVPYQQSVLMAEELTGVGIENELIIIEGGGHGFEGLDDPNAPYGWKKVKAFLRDRLSPDR